MRTAQELFDTAVNGLRQQQAQSLDCAGSHCAYRGEGGRKCAVGFLMDDPDYKPAFEGKSLSVLLSQDLLSTHLQEEFDKNRHLLTDVQQVHDRYPLYSWESRFEIIATKYQLKYTPVQP